MEWWNTGILGSREEGKIRSEFLGFVFFINPSFRHSSVPLFPTLSYQRFNIALGSCGEFHSCYESFRKASQITDEQYEELDELHFKVENELIKLIESLQKKLTAGDWEEHFHDR